MSNVTKKQKKDKLRNSLIGILAALHHAENEKCEGHWSSNQQIQKRGRIISLKRKISRLNRKLASGEPVLWKQRRD